MYKPVIATQNIHMYLLFIVFHLGRRKTSEFQKNDLLNDNKFIEIIAGI